MEQFKDCEVVLKYISGFNGVDGEQIDMARMEEEKEVRV
jgi:hypothetical protein